MGIEMEENFTAKKDSWSERIKESGLKEKIKPFDTFLCGETDKSKLEDSPTFFSKKLEKRDFPLGDDIADVYRMEKDGKPLREIYLHIKSKK